ncbi:aldehyde dehydrogenase family protein [Deinococcus malanensis]|uniref:aldehyde dehydrogenase family protein n=1 Tax=Deinococcus malanensis TaxID=1706855 RepID=UPI003644B98E
MTLPEYPLYIGGQFVPAQSGALVETVNPYTGQAWACVPEAGPEDVNTAVRAARSALDEGPWGRLTGRQRSKLIHRLAQILERDADLLGRSRRETTASCCGKCALSAGSCRNGTSTTRAPRTSCTGDHSQR